MLEIDLNRVETVDLRDIREQLRADGKRGGDVDGEVKRAQQRALVGNDAETHDLNATACQFVSRRASAAQARNEVSPWRPACRSSDDGKGRCVDSKPVENSGEMNDHRDHTL